MDREIAVGDWVRVKTPDKRAKIGVVKRESRGGSCWVVRGPSGEDEFHKSYCQRIRRDRMSQWAREADEGKVYGDGEV